MDKQKIRAAIYARVSTKEQSPEPQLNDLKRYVDDRGYVLYKIYVDEGVSGTKEKRPALDDLMNDARKKRLDVILVWRFDRFARSSQYLVTALEEFNNLGINFISYNENIDLGSPMGKAMFTIISAMAKTLKAILTPSSNMYDTVAWVYYNLYLMNGDIDNLTINKNFFS